MNEANNYIIGTFLRFIGNCINTNIAWISENNKSQKLMCNLLGYDHLYCTWYDGPMLSVYENGFQLQYVSCMDCYTIMHNSIPFYFNCQHESQNSTPISGMIIEGTDATVSYILPEFEIIHNELKDIISKEMPEYRVSMIKVDRK